MKIAVILLGVFVAFVAAEEECPLLAELKRGAESCKESMKPSEETLQHVAQETGLDNRDVQCFQACMMRESGLMKDNKFDIDKMESLLRSGENADDKTITQMVELMKECKDQAGDSEDECEVTGKWVKCSMEKRDALFPKE